MIIEVNKADDQLKNAEDKFLEITDVGESWLQDKLKIYFKKESNK